jgi:hypothetical protein
MLREAELCKQRITDIDEESGTLYETVHSIAFLCLRYTVMFVCRVFAPEKAALRQKRVGGPLVILWDASKSAGVY